MFDKAGMSTMVDLLGSELEYRRDKKTASRQMHFQERMSNTAYQRAMADMQKAGINPIMVTKLGGASTPTGAGFKSADLGKLGSNTIQAHNAMSQARLAKANADLSQQDFDTLKARGLSKSILSGNPINLLINSVINTLSKADQEKAIKGILELFGIKMAKASTVEDQVDKKREEDNIIDELIKLIPRRTPKDSYKSKHDHPSQRLGRKYERKSDHPSQRGRR